MPAPAPQVPPGLPKELGDFVACTSDYAVLRPGVADWGVPLEVGGKKLPPPTVTYAAGDQPGVHPVLTGRRRRHHQVLLSAVQATGP